MANGGGDARLHGFNLDDCSVGAARGVAWGQLRHALPCESIMDQREDDAREELLVSSSIVLTFFL
jgi:hypothetical protein